MKEVISWSLKWNSLGQLKPNLMPLVLLFLYKGGRIAYLNKEGEWLWSPRK